MIRFLRRFGLVVFFYLKITSVLLISCALLACSGGKEKEMESPWAVIGRMNLSRSAAGTVLAGDVVYVTGGASEKGYVDYCEWVEIGPDGTMFGWEMAPSLNEPRGYVASVVYNGYIYAISGANGEHGENLLNTVERAPLNPDGSPGRWIMEKTRLFSSRRGGTAFALNGYVYAIGGYNGEFLDTVERAPILEDGSLGEWDLEAIMLERRYIHSSVVVGRHIYVIGGHERATGGALDKVEFTEVMDDGTLGEWVEAPPINVPRYGASAVSAGGYIYLIGGYDGKAIGTVERASVNPDGSLGPWQIVSHLNIPRDAPSALVHGERIYALGGFTGGRYMSSIESAVITDEGDITAWER